MACWIKRMKWYFDRVRRERAEDGSATPPPPPPPPGGIFPVITSNGGNATAAISAAEGQTAVTIVTATGTAPLTFDIAGGADAAKFNIGSTTGVLTFITAPVYASPTDVGTDNVYDVIARVTNALGQTALQTIAVTVIEVVAGTGPTIISNGGGATAAVSIADGASAITTVQATGTLPIAYSKGGSESSLFSIDPVTGVLALTSSSAYVDGGDNTRDVTVIATNPFGVDSQAITVTIQAPPVVSGDSPTMPLATIIDRMRTNLGLRLIDGTDPPARYPTIRMPINKAFADLVYPPLGAQHNNYFDSYAPWFWCYLAQYNTATGKRLEVRRLRGGVLLDSYTGTWWDSGLRRFQNSYGQVWNARSGTGLAISAYARNQSSESMSIAVTGTTGIEIWCEDFYLNFGRPLFARAQANAWICECRVINEDGTPYTGADAKFLVNLGYDPYNSQRNTPYNATFTSSIYPNAADGGSPTWIVVNGAMGWTSVGGIAVTGTDRSFVDGPPPPFGNFTGNPSSWLGDDSPYVPTPAQLAANPPTFIVT